MNGKASAEANAFYAHFVVAWPFRGTGGYPNLHEALGILDNIRESLRSDLEQRASSLFDNVKLRDLRYQASDHDLPRSLWPGGYPPCIELFVAVEASHGAFVGYNGESSMVADIVESLEDSVKKFFQNHMPRARQGANAYVVKSRWKRSLGNSYTETRRKREYVLIIRR